MTGSKRNLPYIEQMEKLALCLREQEDIKAEFESLRESLSEPFLSKVEHLKNLAIHSLEEEAVAIEEGIEYTPSRIPQIFNVLYKLFVNPELSDALDALDALDESELNYLLSLHVPYTLQMKTQFLKCAIFKEFAILEAKLTTPELICDPSWLIDAVKQQKINVVRRLMFAVPQDIWLKARNLARTLGNKEISDELQKLDNGPFSRIDPVTINLTLGPDTFKLPFKIDGLHRFISP